MSSTLYYAIEEWASASQRTAQDVLHDALDTFYDKTLNDRRLMKFFVSADLTAIKKHQLRFMSQVFSEEGTGEFTDKYLYEIHENLIRDKGLKTVHFDYFCENFVGALETTGMTSELVSRVMESLIPFREVFDKATARFSADREERLFFALDEDGDGVVPEADFRRALNDAGLGYEDRRLDDLYAKLESNGGAPIQFAAFSQILGSAGLLVERALKGELAVPDFVEFSSRLDEIFAVVGDNTLGEQATYIPPLAEIDPEQFGVAVVTTDGQVYVRGEHDVDFSIQSMCKPFNYCFAIEERGEKDVHEHVGNEPSGRAFNDRDLMARFRSSASQRETERIEMPYNPMINAGAIMTAALVKSHEDFASRFFHLRRQWARMIGAISDPNDENIAQEALPRFNKEMARQENYTGFNNLALGYLLMATGKLPHVSRDIPEDSLPEDPNNYEFIHEPVVADALKLYFSTCSLELTAREIATAAATLANGGVCPTTQERVLKQSTVRSCLSVTQMCGMYDGSGDFFYSIGLPAKSGVGGGVMLVVPKLMGICIFSPRLDAQGNSVRGVEVARQLVQKCRLHLYDGVMTDRDRIDPRLPLARWRASQVSEALWAASKGDVRTLLRLHEEQYDLEAGDYDQRTPMHLAAAEGHVEVVEFLLEAGIAPRPDRWGGYPIADAIDSGNQKVVDVFEQRGLAASPPKHLAEDVDGATHSAAEHGDDLAVVELLWAAAENNVAGLRRLVALGVPIHAQDYDRRTALHLAAAEGNMNAVKYLVTHGHPLNVRDRWLATPLDEAVREARKDVAEYLRAKLGAQSATQSQGHQ